MLPIIDANTITNSSMCQIAGLVFLTVLPLDELPVHAIKGVTSAKSIIAPLKTIINQLRQSTIQLQTLSCNLIIKARIILLMTITAILETVIILLWM